MLFFSDNTTSKFFVFTFIFIFLANIVYLQQNTSLLITSVQKVSINEYNIEINRCILFRNVKLNKLKIANKELYELEFPSYRSNSGFEYQNIKILDKKFYDKIVNVLLNNEKFLGSIDENLIENLPSFSIGKFYSHQNENSKLKVHTSIIIDNTIEIGCKIFENNNGNIWVMWPSKKVETSGKWFNFVEFTSRSYQKFIEKQLIEKYRVFKVENSIK
ncbi:MAG: hypothetical protein N2643_03075 [Endomicrobia bacterium]|nr:hypothetical protein [Endomicrobiia bacterium]